MRRVTFGNLDSDNLTLVLRCALKNGFKILGDLVVTVSAFVLLLSARPFHLLAPDVSMPVRFLFSPQWADNYVINTLTAGYMTWNTY